MKKQIFITLFFTAFSFPFFGGSSTAQNQVPSQPGQIQIYDPVDIMAFGSTRSPSGETVRNAIDKNIRSKFLNFAKEGNGFTVAFAQPEVVNNIIFTTANDDHGRDPTRVEIWGSNESIENGFSLIVDNLELSRVSKRFADYGDGAGDNFDNSTAYKYYRVVITGIDRGNANSFQFSEVSFANDGTTAMASAGAPPGAPGMPPGAPGQPSQIQIYDPVDIMAYGRLRSPRKHKVSWWGDRS